MSNVIVVGGGAAGMMAAITAAEAGHRVTLLEKNEKLGKKIYITGKGRCNLTNACDMQQLLDNVVTNRRFLYSAFHKFDNWDTIDFFESRQMATKTERGNRVFPVSDRASDVIRTLAKELERLSVRVHLRTQVRRIFTEECEIPSEGENKKKKKVVPHARVLGVELTNGERIYGDAVVVATGGLSYPTTGSDGDGYRMARELGHNVTRLMPSLVSLIARERFCEELMGLSLKNVSLRFTNESGTTVYEGFGEMLFTHKGVSGPVVLSASAEASEHLIGTTLLLDLKPAITEEQLDARLLREIEGGKAKQMKNWIGILVPQSFGMVLLRMAGISPEAMAGALTKEQRTEILRLLKAFPVHITGMGGYNEAVVTKGGVCVDEVNPATMESKRIRGLYFVGEVLDVDAFTGGYNLQIAWSTGHACGRSIPFAEV